MKIDDKKSSSKSKVQNVRLEEKMNNFITLVEQLFEELEKNLKDRKYLSICICNEYTERKIKDKEYGFKDLVIRLRTDKEKIEIRSEDYKYKRGILIYKNDLMLYGAIFNKEEELLISSKFEEKMNYLISEIENLAETLAHDKAKEYLIKKYEDELKEEGIDHYYKEEIEDDGDGSFKKFYYVYVYDEKYRKYVPYDEVEYMARNILIDDASTTYYFDNFPK